MSSIPAEVKDYCAGLKNRGFGLYREKDRSSLYIPNDNRANDPNKTQIDILQKTFAKECPSLKWDDYRGYVYNNLVNIVGTTYDPASPLLICTNSYLQTYNINEYAPPNFEIAPIDDITPFTDYLARMFPVDEERHIITQWLAHMFQRPEERPSWHLLCTSDMGLGKGYLYTNVLTPLIGRGQVSLCQSSFSEFLNPRGEVFYQTQLCILDDCESENMRDVYGRCKSRLSDETGTVKRLYENGSPQRIFTRCTIFDNRYVVMKIDRDDRRFYAPSRIVDPNDGTTTTEFLKCMDNFLANENGLEQIYNYFMTYSLDGFNHKFIHQTETLKSMIGVTESTLEMDIETWLETNKVFKDADLIREFKTSDNYDNQIRKALVNLGGNKTKANLDGKGEARWWLAKGITKEMAKDILTPSLPQAIEVMEVMEVPF